MYVPENVPTPGTYAWIGSPTSAGSHGNATVSLQPSRVPCVSTHTLLMHTITSTSCAAAAASSGHSFQEASRCWSDAADAASADVLVHTAGRVLEVSLASDPVDAVGDALAARDPVLLVLDDFDRLVAVAPHVVARWAALAPSARMLVTSRERLRVGDERVIGVRPLPVRGSVDLLLDGAAAAGRPLPGADEGLETLARLLDGLPLALELAAARLVVLSPRQLADRLQDPLELLSHGARDAGRHRTLRDAVEASWRLLGEDDRRVLSACAVFRGGFWLEQAEALLSPMPAPAFLDAVQSLLERSLLQAADVPEVPGEPRFSMLMSVRAFAEEALGERRDAVRRRHAEVLAGLAGALARRAEDGHPSARWRLRVELPNLAAVAEVGEPALAARALLAADVVNEGSSHVADRTAAVDRAMAAARASGDPALLALAAYRSCRAALGTASATDWDEALRLVRAAGDPRLEARALLVAFHQSHHEGRARGDLLAQAETIAFSACDPVTVEVVLQGRFVEALTASDFARCEELERRIVAHRRDHGLEWLPSRNLSVWYQRTGRREAAIAATEADLRIHRLRGDREGEASALVNLGISASFGGSDEARVRLEEGIAVAGASGLWRPESVARLHLAYHWMGRGEPDRALAESARAAEISRRHGHATRVASAELASAKAHYLLRRPAEAERCAAQAAEDGSRAGDPQLAALAGMMRAAALAELGQVDAAEAQFAEAMVWVRSQPAADATALREAKLHRALVDAFGDGPARARARSVLVEEERSPGGAGGRWFVRALAARLG